MNSQNNSITYQKATSWLPQYKGRDEWNRACWEVMVVTPDKLVIRDDGTEAGIKSITNDVENVILILKESGLLRPGMRLYYYDSYGVFDQIHLTHSMEFIEFGVSRNSRTVEYLP